MWFGKSEFRLLKRNKNFFDWGGGPRAPPLNTPMVLSALTSAPLSGNDGSPVGVTPGATTGLDILLSAKKWAKRSAIEVAADEEGKSEAHLIAF